MSEQQIFAKCAWRLIPLVTAAFIANYVDRVNIGFAALGMNKQLGFSPEVYGFGAGIFFIGYALFQVPSNLVLHRVGARRLIGFILAGWGACSAAGALIAGPWSFYVVRFLLGLAEAGLVPGVVLYLTFWFPKAWLCRANATFMSAAPVAVVVGGPFASLILGLDGVGGIPGWRWLFLLEGVPPVLLAIAVLMLLPDGPADAAWLTRDEAAEIARQLRHENAGKQTDLLRGLRDPRVLLLGLAHGCYLFAGYGLVFWSPLLIQGLGFSNRATGFVVALTFLVAVPAMILWARSSDQHGERVWHAAIAALIISAGLACAALVPGSPIVLLALAAAAVGWGAWLGPYYSLQPLFLSGPAMAGGIALANATGNLFGGFGGQYLIGVLRQQSGGYSAPFAMISGAALLAAVIVLALGRSIVPRVVSPAVAAE
jgi:ACS family tartrate transporter-like MFS transporter